MSNIDKMVDRFLAWKLPGDFGPDAGVTFNPGHIAPSSPHWPTGTNLLTADQTRQMFEHVTADEPRHAGYISWSPKDVFERAYCEVGQGLSFGDALKALKAGQRVARAGWNGKGMFVYFVPPASYPVQTGAAKAHFGEGAMVPYNAYMAIKNVNETVSTWVPSVNDCLAEDWEILP